MIQMSLCRIFRSSYYDLPSRNA